MKRGFSSYGWGNSLAANRGSRRFRFPLRRMPRLDNSIQRRMTPRPKTRQGVRVAVLKIGDHTKKYPINGQAWGLIEKIRLKTRNYNKYGGNVFGKGQFDTRY